VKLWLYEAGGGTCLALPIEGRTGDTCGTPLGCVEADAVLTVGLPAPGAYDLLVEGFLQDQDQPCYTALVPVDVDGTTPLDLLVPKDPAPACEDGRP